MVAIIGAVQARPAPPLILAAEDAALRKKLLAMNELTGADPLRGRLKEMLADPAGTRKLLAVAGQMVKEQPKLLNRHVAYVLALAAENAREVELSATFFRVSALQSLKAFSERGIAQAYVGLIQLYAANGRYVDCEKVCKEFLAIEGDEEGEIEQFKPGVMRRMLLVITRQGQMDRALKLTDSFIKRAPNSWVYRVWKAQVLREGEKYDEAAKVYLDVIERVEKDDRLKKEERQDVADEYRYALSGVYVDLNQVEKAADQLKKLLARKPDHPTYNNDLGYIWADRGLHLEEAEKLIRKAIDEDRKQRRKLDPKIKPEDDVDNASYLDSLGWVLYKRGKVKEGLPHLVLAVKQPEGQNIEIYDHLADVHLSLGQKKEAVAAWQKGLEVATASKRDQKRKVEVQKKLKAHRDK